MAVWFWFLVVLWVPLAGRHESDLVGVMIADLLSGE